MMLIKKIILSITLATSFPFIAMEGDFATSPVVHEFAYRLNKIYDSLEAIITACMKNSGINKEQFIKTIEGLKEEIQLSEAVRNKAQGGGFRADYENFNIRFSRAKSIVKDLENNSQAIFSNDPEKASIEMQSYYPETNKFKFGQSYKPNEFLRIMVDYIQAAKKSSEFTSLILPHAQKCSAQTKKEIDAWHIAILNQDQPNEPQVATNPSTVNTITINPIQGQQEMAQKPTSKPTTTATTNPPIVPISNPTRDTNNGTPTSSTQRVINTPISNADQTIRGTNSDNTSPSSQQQSKSSWQKIVYSPWFVGSTTIISIAALIAMPIAIYFAYKKGQHAAEKE